MSQLNVLDRNGGQTIEWDVASQAEVDAARETYTKLRKEGYMAYSVDGGTREQIREFDPTAAEIVMMSQIVGG